MIRPLLLAAVVGPVFCIAHAADKVPATDFVKHPQLSNVVLSPDGKALAGVRFVNGRRNLLVVDIATRKATIITNYRDADVVNMGWINANRLFFSLQDFSKGSGDQIGGGLFAIDKNAEGYRQLAETSDSLSEGRRLLSAQTSMHSRVYKDGVPTDEVLVSVGSIQARGQFATNLYRLNTRTGVSSIATLGAPGNILKWVVDRNAVPRAGVSVLEGVSRVYFRESESSPWRVISEFTLEQRSKGIDPIAFDSSGRLYVSSYRGNDTEAIYRWDPKTGDVEPEPVVASKLFDVNDQYSQFVFDGRRDRLLGIRYETEKLQTVWFDQGLADLQRMVDSSIPNAVNTLSGNFLSPDDLVLVHSYSDRDPGRYLLYYPAKKQLEQIAVTRPWVDPKRMAETKWVRYKARDGLVVPALLTLPSGATKGLPLVVMHYGGPQVRAIRWGWDPHVQFLAARGYAVLMPAPRMSTGYGWKHFTAGWKQWGLAMQDDLTDGARWLISEGTVDPKRVCIAGASYGGYATMMGLVKEPELFRCGVNWVGVTDPEFMFTVTWTDFNRVDAARYDLPILMGEPDKYAEQFRRTSPLRRASEIKQPVLMAYGGLDQRVPIVNGERMRDALAKHNPNVEWIVYSDEGHGWLREENNIDFWNRVGQFLDKYLGAGPK